MKATVRYAPGERGGGARDKKGDEDVQMVAEAETGCIWRISALKLTSNVPPAGRQTLT